MPARWPSADLLHTEFFKSNDDTVTVVAGTFGLTPGRYVVGLVVRDAGGQNTAELRYLYIAALLSGVNLPAVAQ